MARQTGSQSAFARQLGIDRSTLSQLLSPQNDRLPRAETLVAIARGCRVSVDWLLGLTVREQIGAEMLEAMLQFEPQAHAPIDDRFLRWQAEAAGRKVRTVPMTFPDFTKLDSVVRHEYEAALAGDPGFSLEEKRQRIRAMIEEGSEMEVCATVEALETFAAGRGQWAGLDRAVRVAQLEEMAALVHQLYPAFRMFLYDLRQTYSAPFTLFGQQRAVVYLGPSYLVLNASEHIRLLSRRFDDLIRLAVIQPHAIEAHLLGLAARVAAPASSS